jgi:ABC-2 type transport system permease protein
MTTAAVARPRPIAPSAFGDDFRRFVNLTVTLARVEFKLRYFGSVLGYLWSLVRPLLFFLVLYLVFTKLFRFGRGVQHFPVYLLTAVMLWSYFVETTSGGVQCLVKREDLLRNVRFPRLVIPLSVALTAAFNLAINFVVVISFALASGVTPRLSWLQLPGLVLLVAVLAVGVGMLLSVLYVRFRDVEPIWDVVIQVAFYLCPIIYTAGQYKGLVRIAMCNPLAAIFTQMLHAFVDPTQPNVASWIGGSVRLLIPLGIVVGAFVVGLWYFNREAPRIAENL